MTLTSAPSKGVITWFEGRGCGDAWCSKTQTKKQYSFQSTTQTTSNT